MDYVVFDRNLGQWITKEEHENLIDQLKNKKITLAYFNNLFILNKNDALYKYFEKQIEKALNEKQLKLEFFANEKK